MLGLPLEAPAIIRENVQLFLFFGALTYALLVINWIVTTDWESKFHWCSMAICASGLFYLHYHAAELLEQYENAFVTLWLLLLSYHGSAWRNNFRQIREELDKKSITASLRPYQGSLFSGFITMPTTKNAANQWNDPPFKNAIHVLLILGYSSLIVLHLIPFVTPMHCRQDALCCRYNYVMQGFDSHKVNQNFCSGKVQIGFAGSWSTGKTFVIGSLLGHPYSTAQSSPAPSTDKFVCITMGAPYADPIRSDDYEQRRHCEMMGHMNDVTHKLCGMTLPNVVDVADTNQEFENFVFFDMPGWQREYGDACTYRSFYQQLLDKVDFTYIVCKLYLRGVCCDSFLCITHDSHHNDSFLVHRGC